MRRPGRVAMVLLSSSSLLFGDARAQERGSHEQQERGAHAQERRGPAAARPAPPRFQAHPPGVHPHGPIVRQHPVRVMAPRVVARRGAGGWAHWAHPEFARPVYYWDWSVVHSVTCTAEDSYGDQYPVTEGTGPGFGLDNMSNVEDDALDRCYAESGQDGTCYLLTCSHP